MKFNTLALVAASLLVGCGIPDDRLLTEIDSDLWAKVCAKVAEPQDALVCDEVEVSPAMTEAEHEAACNDAWGNSANWEGCTATFGDWIAYNDYDAADPCDPTDQPSNTAAIDCLIDDMMANM